MIKFFRKIRKHLLSEGKTGKYLKYALGEIILVMIGILLALQVNNWNEYRKSQQAKRLYVNRLISDLKADVNAFSFHLNSAKSKANDGKYIMTVINDNKPIVNDKIFVLRLQNVGRVFVPKKANNTFLDLQGSGNLKLFKDVSLVNEIRKYYISDVDFWYAHYVERTTEGFLPIVTEILPFRIAEEIINSEIKENPNLSPFLNYENYDISISSLELEEIVTNIKSHSNFNFNLKNATRAHLLQQRIDNENINQANHLIQLLEKLNK